MLITTLSEFQSHIGKIWSTVQDSPTFTLKHAQQIDASEFSIELIWEILDSRAWSIHSVRRLEVVLHDYKGKFEDLRDAIDQHAEVKFASIDGGLKILFKWIPDSYEYENEEELFCSSLTVRGAEEILSQLIPWALVSVFKAQLPSSHKPTPLEWVRLFEKRGEEVVWRVHGGEARCPSDVPDDYEGFFLQFPKLLKEVRGGLYFEQCRSIAAQRFLLEVNVDMYRYAQSDSDAHPATLSLMRTMGEIVAEFPGASISSGNVSLTGARWLEFLRTGKIGGPCV